MEVISNKTKILYNQSLFDLAIQHTGIVENAFALAVANGLRITDDLVAGESLPLTAYGLEQNKEILNYYQGKNIQPATAISGKQEAGNRLEGIGYWTIQTEFIIS